MFIYGQYLVNSSVLQVNLFIKWTISDLVKGELWISLKNISYYAMLLVL